MSTSAPVNWDSPRWGKPGFNIHHATTDDLGNHGKGCDETGDEQ